MRLRASTPFLVVALAGCSGGETITITGTVSELLDGSAIPEVDVCVLELADEDGGGCVQTGSDGTYTFPGVEADAEITLRFSLDGYVPVRSRLLSGAEDRTLNVTLLTPGQVDVQAALLGTTADQSLAGVGLNFDDVSTADSTGVPGATATLTPASGEGPFYIGESGIPDADQAETTEDALVSWINVQPGDYTIDASVTGYDCAVRYGLPGDTATRIDLTAVAGEISLTEFACVSQ